MKIVITVDVPDDTCIPRSAEDISNLFFGISDGQVGGAYTVESEAEAYNRGYDDGICEVENTY